MAEVVGLVTGVVGVAPVFAKCIKSIRTFRKIRTQLAEIPDQVKSLIDDLEALEPFIRQLDQASTIDTSRYQTKLDSLNNGLVEFLDKVPSDFEEKREKAKLIWKLRHWKQDVEALNKIIQAIKLDLILYGQLGHAAQMKCLSEFINAKLLDPLHVDDVIPKNGSSQSKASATNLSPKLANPGSHRRPRESIDCRRNCCACSCHCHRSVSRRFWGLEYTDWKTWIQPCDRNSCSASSYKFRLKVVLSQFGIPWSTTVEMLVSTGSGLQIQPSLRLEQVVRYTSPGFAAIWQLMHGQTTLNEARRVFINLSRNDNTFRMHVDPSGISYLEALLRIPWISRSREQFALADFLIDELQASRGFEDKRLLIICARWIGIGSPMDPLEWLMKHGFDPNSIPTLHASEWPKPFSPCGEFLDDIFFIGFLKTMCKDNQGCAGMSPLHEAVLFFSSKDVEEWCGRREKDEKNFLGQTPLHLAITRPDLVRILIDTKHDINAVDAYGRTPLMYAATYNELQTVTMLIDAGANVFAVDGLANSTFLHYAARSEHWVLIYHSLNEVKKLSRTEVTKILVRQTLILYLVRHPDVARKRTVTLNDILSVYSTVNFEFSDQTRQVKGNTLLHYVRKFEDVEALLNHGFTLLNYRNGRGEHALMGITYRDCDLDVFQRLLDAGSAVDLQDNAGHTTLHHIMERLKEESMFYPVLFDRLHALVSRGANALCRDGCRCSCSPQGCLPAGFLGSRPVLMFTPSKLSAISILEWVFLIFEKRGGKEARETVLALIRKATHEILGMTHVCCQRMAGPYTPPLPVKDVDEILEEEDEFIQMLDQKMCEISTLDFASLLTELLHVIEAKSEQSAQEDSLVQLKYSNQIQTEHCQLDCEIDVKKDVISLCPAHFPFSLEGMDAMDPMDNIKQDIGHYVRWLEVKYRANERAGDPIAEEYYYRRLSWLYSYAEFIGISEAAIIRNIRSPRRPELDDHSFSACMEEYMEHFKESWMKWKHGK